MTNHNLRLLGLEEAFLDLSDKRAFLPISGGINSAAVLCYLATIHPEHLRPKEVFSFYAHLKEHSPDTVPFVRAVVTYGKKHFEQFHFKLSVGSVNALWKRKNMVAHPMLSPCTEWLKLIPMMQYKAEIDADIDLMGYVWHERKRMERQQGRAATPDKYAYPIINYSDEDCFALVKQEIGWYPAIYDIRDGQGNRVFRHNNCLPCKNMQGNLLSDGTATKHYAAVQHHYPAYYQQALETTREIEARTGKPTYWGRKMEDDSTDTGCTDYVCAA